MDEYPIYDERGVIDQPTVVDMPLPVIKDYAVTSTVTFGGPVETTPIRSMASNPRGAAAPVAVPCGALSLSVDSVACHMKSFTGAGMAIWAGLAGLFVLSMNHGSGAASKRGRRR